MTKACRDELTAAGFAVDGDSVSIDDSMSEERLEELFAIARRHGMVPKSIGGVTAGGDLMVIPVRGPSA